MRPLARWIIVGVACAAGVCGGGWAALRLWPQPLDSIAIDNQPEMVRHVHRKARTEGFANVTARVATTDDPQLPRDADLVFVCDVLMHVGNKTSWLKSIYDQMHSGSRFVLIDFKEGALPEGPPEAIKVPQAEIQRLCREAGFQLHADRADLLPYQQFLVFQRP